ncbi:TPR domain-containing glycosyltransferase [Brevibacillus nitrificans]|uniref:TPR domain-containing glycosyltransferase n=1 Tax=Brevibacillus nitrificans TaxID=651560 RepID=UPI0026056350|nr:TPR domain-containing glycosyltransferase [Brevibacillus nitrificans]
MKISLCMIVKNEEEVLRECLESVKGIVSEIVAVDTGSTDSTIEILKEYGANIKQITWENDFSAARNVSLEEATGTHILVLDADERLLSSRDELVSSIAENPHSPLQVLCKNDLDSEISIHRVIRIFPNDPAFRFQGAIHETIYREEFLDIGVPSTISIWHIGYQKERYDKRSKKEFYLRLYENELQSRGEDGYILYQMAKLLYSTGEYTESLPYFEKSVRYGEVHSLYYPVMLVMYGYVLKQLNRSMEAMEMLVDYIDPYPDFPDLFFLLGLLSMDAGLLENTELAFQQCVEIGETQKYATVQGVGSYRATHNLGVLYEVTGQQEKAIEWYRKGQVYGYSPSEERLKAITSQ